VHCTHRSESSYTAIGLAWHSSVLSLGNVIAPPTDAIGPVQEVPPIAQSRFRVLVNRDDDGLHVVKAVALPYSHVAYIGQRLSRRQFWTGATGT
jgi:hypothetical protein